MGEIFLMERPGDALRFTGERLTTAISGQIEIEHLHRYFLVRDMARGKDVLDIACGEGYGAALLAQVARSVVGMDVSPEALEHAVKSYPRSNLEFRSADARRIDAPDAAFDLVASFETLEHFYEHEQFYGEVRRVLRPGGLLVISTPDRDVYSPEGSIANPYHVRELTRAEFVSGLEAVFPHVALLLQRPMIGSLMLAAEPSTAEARELTFEQRGRDTFEMNYGFPRALYLIAFASDQPLRVPVASAYVETSQLEVREAENIRQRAVKDAEFNHHLTEIQTQTERRVAEVQTQAERRVAEVEAEAEQHLAEAKAQAEQHSTEVQSRAERNMAETQAQAQQRVNLVLEERSSAEIALAKAQEVLFYIHHSKSWRVTAPLRALMRMRPMQRFRAHTPNVVPAAVISQMQPPEAVVSEAIPPKAARDPTAWQIPSVVERLRQQQALGVDLPAPQFSFSVGIVTFNSDEEMLARCLSSAEIALANVNGSGEILVLDNGATSADRKGVRKLAGQGNIGFGVGHNTLMREAFAGGADAYVAVNPDGALHPYALERLSRVICAHEGRALVEACQFPAEHPKEFNTVTLETPWASGACLAIPRAVFETTGGFDDHFFMYCEDVDLSWRVRAAGMKVLIAPHAYFMHAVTNRTGDSEMRRMMLASAVILGRKWGNEAFAGAASSELMAIGGVIPPAVPDPVPEDWRDIPDFSRNFSFAPVRW